jgi:hypothetical protein
VGGFDSTEGVGGFLIVIGLIFCFIALGLRRASDNAELLTQLALPLSLVGQSTLVGGLGLITESVTPTALLFIGLEVLLFVVYPDGLHRFLSALSIPGAVLILLADWQQTEATHLLVLALAVGIAVVWEHETRFTAKRIEHFTRPLAYSLPIALLGILGFSVVKNSGNDFISLWWISTLGLLATLLGLGHVILSQQGLRRSQLWATLISVALAFLPTLQAPGIVAGILVLLVGFRRGNRGLMGVAAAFLTVFIIAFYYNLETTLFLKSLALLGTGLACFALRYFLSRYLWQSEVTV